MVQQITSTAQNNVAPPAGGVYTVERYVTPKQRKGVA